MKDIETKHLLNKYSFFCLCGGGLKERLKLPKKLSQQLPSLAYHSDSDWGCIASYSSS